MRYYVAIALRNIARNKGFAFLNIIGFAFGLSSFLLIAMYVNDELSYDKFNQHHDAIFRVDTELKYGGAVTSFAIAAPPVAEAMLREFPEVEHAVRIEPLSNLQLKKGTSVIQEDRAMLADQSLFDVFSLHVLDGNANKALTDPGVIVISKSIALKYFGDIHVSGKTITIANENSVHTISAVIDDIPSQSHFHADIFLPLISRENARSTSFNQFSFNTYLLLKGEHHSAALSTKLQAFLNNHLNSNMNVEAFEKGGNYIRLVLTPLDDIHLYSNKQRELEANADITYVYIFSAIALLILGLACINFINLFTARSANRAKEVGLRKMLGSVRGNIMVQFLLEAFVMTLISVVIAVLIVSICLPVFNTLSGKQFEPNFTTLLRSLPAIAIVTIIVTVVAGIYPAFFLSSFQPAKVLMGTLSSGFKSSRLRGFLVVIQFSIATFLVIGTFVILHQLQFIQSRHVGFDREQVIIIHNVGAMDDPAVMKAEVKELSGVSNASLSAFPPTGDARWQSSASLENTEGLLAEFWTIDTDYVATLGMNMSEGRSFSANFPSDSSAMILNESAAKILVPDATALDKRIQANGKTYTVIGIVRDFNFNSLRQNVTPLVMTLDSDWRAKLIVRTTTGQLPNVLDQISSKWKKINPNHDFEYSFMDKDFEALYITEQRMKKLFSLFTVLAVIIAGVGLFGLSAYALEQRTNELSIRKILGASVGNLFKLLTLDFVRLILISLVIAIPTSWWIMQQWLNGFANHINIPLVTLFFSAGMILAVALLTISYQTLKAAKNNPVDSLRSK